MTEVLELYAKQINNLIYYFKLIKITFNDKYMYIGAEKFSAKSRST